MYKDRLLERGQLIHQDSILEMSGLSKNMYLFHAWDIIKKTE